MIKFFNKRASLLMLLGVGMRMWGAASDPRAKQVVGQYFEQLDGIARDQQKKVNLEEMLFESGHEELTALLEAKTEYEEYRQALLDGFGADIDKSNSNQVFRSQLLQSVLDEGNSFFSRLTPEKVQFFANLANHAYGLDSALSSIADQGLMGTASRTQAQIDANKNAIQQLNIHIQKIIESVETKKKTGAINRDELERIFRGRGKDEAFVVTIGNASGLELSEILIKERAKIEQENMALEDLLVIEKAAQKLQIFLDRRNLQKLQAQGVFYRHGGEASAFAAYNPEENTLYMSFAGTKSWSDFLTDIQAWKANVALSQGGDLLENMKFHAGFAQLFGNFFEQTGDNAKKVIEALCERSKKENYGEPLKIVATGHSLGGALAIVFSAAMQKYLTDRDCKVEVMCITFGSPAIISASSQANLVERFKSDRSPVGYGNIVNVQHKFDPVPRLAVHLSLPGVTVPFGLGMFTDRMGDFNIIPTLNPHGMDNYMQGANLAFQKVLDLIPKVINPVAEIQKGINEYNRVSDPQGAHSFEDLKAEITSLDEKILQGQKSLDDFVAGNRAVFNSKEGVDLVNKGKKDIEEQINNFKEMEQKIDEEIAKKESSADIMLEERHRYGIEIDLLKWKVEQINKIYKTYLEVIQKEAGDFFGKVKGLFGK